MNRIAVFDFDGTIIRGDSVISLLFFARKEKLLSSFGLLRAGIDGLLYKIHLIDALTAKMRSHAFLRHLTPERRVMFLRDFARTLADRAYPQALAQIKLHHDQGDLVLLCSASCACYMQYVAPLIGADALLSTPCAPDGSVIGPNCRGQEKVNRVFAWLDAQGLPHDALDAAYGDSKSDAPILRAVKHPVLVNAKRGLIHQLPQAVQMRWNR